MPAYTVAQFKNAVSKLPAGADNFKLMFPEGLVVPVVAGLSKDPDGTIRYTVKGYIDFDNHTWYPV